MVFNVGNQVPAGVRLRHNAMMSMRRKSRGFTIIEAALSVAIVGVLLTISMTSFAAIAKQRKVQMERRVGYELGRQLMGEVLQQYFQDPVSAVFGPESGET